MCVWPNYEQNILSFLSNLRRGGGGKIKGQRSISRSIMIFQKIKVETSVIHLFHEILNGKSISFIIFMIQGHLQGQKVKAWNIMCNTYFSWDFDWTIYLYCYFSDSRLSSRSKKSTLRSNKQPFHFSIA